MLSKQNPDLIHYQNINRLEECEYSVLCNLYDDFKLIHRADVIDKELVTIYHKSKDESNLSFRSSKIYHNLCIFFIKNLIKFNSDIICHLYPEMATDILKSNLQITSTIFSIFKDKSDNAIHVYEDFTKKLFGEVEDAIRQKEMTQSENLIKLESYITKISLKTEKQKFINKNLLKDINNILAEKGMYQKLYNSLIEDNNLLTKENLELLEENKNKYNEIELLGRDHQHNLTTIDCYKNKVNILERQISNYNHKAYNEKTLLITIYSKIKHCFNFALNLMDTIIIKLDCTVLKITSTKIGLRDKKIIYLQKKAHIPKSIICYDSNIENLLFHVPERMDVLSKYVNMSIMFNSFSSSQGQKFSDGNRIAVKKIIKKLESEVTSINNFVNDLLNELIYLQNLV